MFCSSHLLVRLRPFTPSNPFHSSAPLSNMFFSVTIQIKRFALFTMACSKYPSNVIEATVWCRTTFEISLLSYSTYQINALWVYPLRISQFWSKPHEAVWDRWKTAQRFRGKYFRPIFVKNVVVIGEKHDVHRGQSDPALQKNSVQLFCQSPYLIFVTNPTNMFV